MIPEPVATLYRPVNITLTSYGVILSYRHNDTATLLARLDSNGTVQPYAASFAGVQEVYLAEANGSAGFAAGDLFLCSGDSVYRMAGGAGNAELFATPSKGSTVEYISFDPTGLWGHLLYALTGDGGVWAVSANGASSLVTNLGSNLVPEGLAVAPATLGGYAGDLLVTMENSHNIVAIPRNATDTHITLATFEDQAPERVLVVPLGMNLLIAKYDRGTVVEIPATSLAGYAGLAMVITEGEKGQTGSINVLKATGTNVTSTILLADTSSPHFEGAAFVPQTYPVLGSETTSTSTGLPVGPSGEDWILYAAAGGIAVAVVVLVAAMARSQRRV